MVDVSTFPRGIPGRDSRNNIPPYATWADPELIANHPKWQYEHGRIFIGSLLGKAIGVDDNRHLMTIAGSRAGKGVSAIIPNLLLYPGSVLVIDPKGENAQRTANRRGAGARGGPGLGQSVFVLDPFGRSGHTSSQYNPLSSIDVENEAAVDDAALIAEALVIESGGNESRHWTSAARNFLRGLVLFVCAMAKPEQRNLIYVRELLMLDLEGQSKLFAAMMACTACNGVIRRTASSMVGKDPKERSSVLSTAIEQTDFLDSPQMARCLARSDFELGDLKDRPTSVYLCLPASRMETHNRWLRLVINLAVQAMEARPGIPPHPVLFVMDEFAILNHLSSIEKAAGQIAGLGVKLWPILQDLSQLKSIYSDRWETFMGNAGLLQFFGNNDLTTLEYLARRLGTTTITQVTRGEISSAQQAQGFTGTSLQNHSVELMTAAEVGFFFSRQKQSQLVLWPGANPIALDRVEYFDPQAGFAGLYDPI